MVRIARMLTPAALFAAAALLGPPTAFAAHASPSATATTAPGVVVDGNARFTVESPTLIRVEYAGDGAFQDAPTFTAVNRNMAGAPYTTSVSGGYRIIQTSALTIRYLENSGPVNGSNLTVGLTAGSQAVTAHPVFPAGSDCAYPNGCEAENLTLSGGASVASDHSGYTGTGFVAGFTQSGARIGWQATNIPAAGQYAVQFRYANSLGGDGRNQTRTVTLTANGQSQQVSLPTTADWNTWAISSTTVTLPAGTSPMSIACGTSDSCNVNVDSVAVTQVGAAYPTPPTPPASHNLGGYRRSLDGQSGAASMADGVLSRDGWYLLDDTNTGLRNADGTVTPRPGHNGAPYQDGYFFGYGHRYKQGLQDFHDLTGPAAMLPRSAFGVWYSRYYGYSLSDYQNTLIPAFRANQTPIDQLVADTDWKAPSQWDGWEFNPNLFPDPKALFGWAASQNLQMALNIHPTIETNDPQYPATNATAGGTLINGTNFDFRNPNHLKAFFNLHSNIENNYGTPVWWLDQNTVGAPNVDVSPDSYINAAYKAHADALGRRGYDLARIGGNGIDYNTFTPAASAGWADHRSAVHFTGDTYPTWSMLAFEAQFTATEGAGIGEPYVSHDIGGFNQNSAYASGGHDNPDLYARWVQLGTFQPILRLHSDHGYRLPWDYDATTQAAAEKFLRLREALVPYTYTLAHEATVDGMPIVRALYLNYPEYNEAYTNSTEYTYGNDVLVAPVTTPGAGTVTTSVWFPPGTWTDYFTGQTYTGPGTAQVSTGLDTMPVFLRGGGIMATRTDYVDSANASPLTQVTVDAAAGADGAYSLYEDDGVTQSTASAATAISYTEATHTLTIGAMSGTYTGAVANRTWTVKVHNVTAGPTQVTVDGAAAAHWSYDPTTRTLTVLTGSQPTSAAVTVAYTPSTVPVGPIVGVGSGRCVDVPNADPTDGNQLQLYDCNNTNAQSWSFPGDGTIRALGKCMDVRGANSADATPVQLYTCNGTNAQQWTYNAATKEFLALGKCLDASGAGTANGTKLIIYTCHGRTNQQWSHP